jgi:hypothetical protein
LTSRAVSYAKQWLDFSQRGIQEAVTELRYNQCNVIHRGKRVRESFDSVSSMLHTDHKSSRSQLYKCTLSSRFSHSVVATAVVELFEFLN